MADPGTSRGGWRDLLRMARRPVGEACCVALLLAGFLFLPLAPLGALELEVGGVRFSDEAGGFRLLDVTGSGVRDDPFVVVEEITDPHGAMLTIRGLDDLMRRRSSLNAGPPFIAIWLVKVVLNSTGQRWSSFDHELREHVHERSPYGDGLSFDQLGLADRPFLSDRFSQVHEHLEPADILRYRNGQVATGDRATFSYVITDTTPIPTIFLVQMPSWPVSEPIEESGRPKFAMR